ncbi:Retrovirus-related Pol polyprotein from transposon 297 [Vitis vinifera]|uniref:Retrovirus-related Pol polyprotein from transposon 297 n=1 Tax=Vitis vinifera TaxID=29760 RepID=A0A438H8L7_VITVI|nr:Retrovirus-related Pol polyprotein from transposon 297 [Vitis vinifera]
MRGTASSSCSEHTWTFSHGPIRTCRPRSIYRLASFALLPHARPVKQKLRRLHPCWSLQVNEDIQKQLSVGFLSVVEYPEWLANVVLVSQKGRQCESVCVDFLDLNEASPKDDFPFPHIDMLVNSTTGHSIVMPFGLKNAGATYQRGSDHLFHDMMHRDVEAYVDDMIVKSRERPDHLVALERFFERIQQFRLRLNPKKCTFGVTSRKLLGYVVSEKGIEVDPNKIRAILDMPALRMEREVRGFLGRLQYISRFIARLTDIYEPIFRLLRKSQPTLDDSGKDRAICYLSKRMLDYEARYVMIECYWLGIEVHQKEHCRGSLSCFTSSDGKAIDDDFPDEDVADVTSLSGWRISVCLAFSDQHPATNNIVEYEACILGLETALELGIRQTEVFGDSNLVSRQIQGEWKTRDVKA